MNIPSLTLPCPHCKPKSAEAVALQVSHLLWFISAHRSNDGGLTSHAETLLKIIKESA